MALISKEELEEMYWGEPGTEMGSYQISKIVGCTPQTIYNYLKKYNIDIRKRENGECMVDTTKEIISSQQKEWLKDNPNFWRNNRGKRPTQKISKKQAIDVFNEYNNSNIKYKELSKKYNISMSLVGYIVRKEHWATKHLKDD